MHFHFRSRLLLMAYLIYAAAHASAAVAQRNSSLTLGLTLAPGAVWFVERPAGVTVALPHQGGQAREPVGTKGTDAMTSPIAAAMAPTGMTLLPVHDSVDAAWARLEAAVAARQLRVFARIDFAADAAAAGLAMPPARLLLFGQPRAGTPLLVAAPSVALDLPLKIVIYEDRGGRAWVGFNTPEYLAQRHGLPPDLLPNIAGARAIAAAAAGP